MKRNLCENKLCQDVNKRSIKRKKIKHTFPCYFEYWSIELQNFLVSWLDPFTLRIIYVLYPCLLEFLKLRVSVKSISVVADGYPCALKLMNDGSHLFLGNGSVIQLQLSRQFENLKILDAKTFFRGNFIVLTFHGQVLSIGKVSDVFLTNSLPIIQFPDHLLINNVKRIYVNCFGACVALKQNGDVITWGCTMFGGDSGVLSIEMKIGIKQIIEGDYGFLFLNYNGSAFYCCRVCEVAQARRIHSYCKSNVIGIFAIQNHFGVLKSTGAFYHWNGLSCVVNVKINIEKVITGKGIFLMKTYNGCCDISGSRLNSYFRMFQRIHHLIASGVNNIFFNGQDFAITKEKEFLFFNAHKCTVFTHSIDSHHLELKLRNCHFCK